MKGNVCEGGGYIISVVIFSFVYNASKFLEFETTYYQQVELFVIFSENFESTLKIFFQIPGDNSRSAILKIDIIFLYFLPTEV